MVEKAKPSTESAKILAPEEKVAIFCKENALQLVTTVAVVGIYFNSRSVRRIVKKAIKNMDKNIVNTQETITALKMAGKPFTFYPGVGVFVE